MIDLPILHWAASITSVLGALLLALNVRISRWGYPLFLVGSVMFLGFAIKAHDEASTFMWAVYTALNVIGFRRWLLR